MPDTLDRPCTTGEEPSSSRPPHRFEPRDVIAGRYRIERLLGRGGSGEVWEAIDQLADAVVAVKILWPTLPRSLARARREILALRILQVPGVVRLLDDGVEGGLLFLVMERVYGAPFPGKGRRGSWEDLAEVAVALLETLARIHAAGIIHGDVKPENVLVNAEGRPTVLDFGISAGARLGQRLEQPGELVGTPRYLAPEQILGEAATVQTDLYAFGLLLYEALTGQFPHEAQDVRALLKARLTQQAPPLKSRAPGVPTAIAGLVDLLLSRQPEQRPRSAAEVLGILQGQAIPPSWMPLLPRLDGGEPVERVLRAVRAGRSVDVVGARHTGRTRCLQEVAEALRQDGIGVEWATSGYMPFASLERLLTGLGERVRSLSEITEAVDARLREELSGGIVLMIDDAERLDPWSARALARCGSAGVLVRTLLEKPLEGSAEVVRLEPLSMAALEHLFAGPERLFHLRSDAARILWIRTAGLQVRVADELTTWLRAGIARWDGNKLTVDREGLDTLEVGMRALPVAWSAQFEVPTGAPLPPHLEDMTAWIAIASPISDLSVIATAMGLELWQIEAGLQDLQERGRVRRLPDGRVELSSGTEVALVLPVERRKQMHRAIAKVMPEGAQGRLRHLIQGAGDDEVADAEALGIVQEAKVLARRLAREGRLGQAMAALEQGLLVIRRSTTLPVERTSALEEGLLASWVEIALQVHSPHASAKVLYELSVTSPKTMKISQLEELVGAAEALFAGGERSLTLVNAVSSFRDIDLERQRQWLRLCAARNCSPEIEEAVLEDVTRWVETVHDATTRARYSGWLGRLRYRQGRYAEAAELHLQATAHEPWVTERIAAQLNAAYALMETFRYRDAAMCAEEARNQARACRHVFHEARAEWILRSTAYRMGEATEPDLELLEAVLLLGVADLEASICINEAAVAYRAGNMRLAAELADRAGRTFSKAHANCYVLLGKCLAMAAGAQLDAEEADVLIEDALVSTAPWVGIQALGLLAKAGVRLQSNVVAALPRLLKAIPKSCWDLRLEVLSQTEALSFIRDAERASGATARPHPATAAAHKTPLRSVSQGESGVSPLCLNAWFPDHPCDPIRLRLGVPAQMSVSIGPPRNDHVTAAGPVPGDASDTLEGLEEIDIAVICPGAQVRPLRQRLQLPPESSQTLTWTITPRRRGTLNLQILLLLHNEPVHRVLWPIRVEEMTRRLRVPKLSMTQELHRGAL